MTNSNENNNVHTNISKAKKLSIDDHLQFVRWMNFDTDAITWHGKNIDSWKIFLDFLFSNEITVNDLFIRFSLLERYSSIGPIRSWILWIKDSYLCYLFCFHHYSIRDIALTSEIQLPNISVILRNFFVETFPEKEEYFNHKLAIRHKSQRHASLLFSEIKAELCIDYPRSNSKSMMNAFEVTLYENWNTMIQKIQNATSDAGGFENIQHNNQNVLFKIRFKIVRDLILLVTLGLVILVGIHYANQWYEIMLEKQVSVYEPEKIQRRVTEELYRERPNLNPEQLKVKNIEELKDIDNSIVTAIEAEEFSTESDITLTSWDSGAKSFANAENEKSYYEENEKSKGGFRDLVYGDNIVYRVMMRTPEGEKNKTALLNLLATYKATQVDQVKPGQEIPGGVYYNIYIPVTYLKEFLSKVMEVDESILFQNKTQSSSPAGKSKVMIWVKLV